MRRPADEYPSFVAETVPGQPEVVGLVKDTIRLR
jgi:hypothetical protein